MSQPVSRGNSTIKEALASWGDIARLLRGGDQGALVPVVIPRDSRGLKWMTFVWVGIYLVLTALVAALAAGEIVGTVIAVPALFFGIISLALALLWWWRSSIVEIEQGTTGVLTKFGAIVAELGPGRHYLWQPWTRVDAWWTPPPKSPTTPPCSPAPPKRTFRSSRSSSS